MIHNLVNILNMHMFTLFCLVHIIPMNKDHRQPSFYQVTSIVKMYWRKVMSILKTVCYIEISVI